MQVRPRFWFCNATPLPWDFGPRETGSGSGGSQFSVRPAAHTQLGAVGLGSRLLGIPLAPASEAAPGPGLTSQGPTKRILAFSIAVRRRQAHRSPPQRSQETALWPRRSGSSRADWRPLFPWRRSASRGPTGVGGSRAWRSGRWKVLGSAPRSPPRGLHCRLQVGLCGVRTG